MICSGYREIIDCDAFEDISRSNLPSADLKDVVEEVAEICDLEGSNEPVERIQGFGTGVKYGDSSGAGLSTICVDNVDDDGCVHNIGCE